MARVPRLMHKLLFDYIRSLRWLARCVIHFCILVEQPCWRASWLAFGVHLVTMCRTAVHASVCSACIDFYLNLALESDGGTNADRLPGRPLVVVVEESDD